MESLSMCNPWKNPNEKLEEPERRNFHKNMKHTVWIVLVTTKKAGKRRRRLATGVSLNSNGYIVTSSIRLNSGSKIKVRGVGEEDFIKAKIVKRVTYCGLAILKADLKCSYAEVGDGMNLTDGIEVYSISHPSRVLRYSLYVGRVISRLYGKENLDLTRLSGKENLDIKEPVLKRYCRKKFRADVKFMPIHGFSSHSPFVRTLRFGYEVLGAPVFNAIGQVIGVVVACGRGIDYAVPSDYLQDMIKRISNHIRETSKEHTTRGESSTRD